MTHRLLKLLLLLALTGWSACPLLAEDSSSVVVVYNTKSPESQRVAEYYAERRQVPKEQLIGLELPTDETMSREDYRKKLEEPLWQSLLAKKLFTLKADAEDNKLTTPSVATAKIRYAKKNIKNK